MPAADPRNLPPVRHEGDVTLKTLPAGAHAVHVGGSLTVSETIAPAQLSTGGGLTIAGGIVGRGTGRCTVGGDLRCRFITDAQVTARGDVRVTDEVVRSRLTCVGRLELPAGDICGGDVSANGGVACRTLGDAGGTPTFVEVGDGRAMLVLTERVSAQIAADRKRIEDARAAIGPMLDQIKQLSPQDKEKVTEMMYETGELEAATNNLAAALERRQQLLRQRAKPEVFASKTVHAGVVIRFGTIECVIPATIKGPVTFLCRIVGDATQVVAVDATDASTRVLESHPIPTAVAA